MGLGNWRVRSGDDNVIALYYFASGVLTAALIFRHGLAWIDGILRGALERRGLEAFMEDESVVFRLRLAFAAMAVFLGPFGLAVMGLACLGDALLNVRTRLLYRQWERELHAKGLKPCPCLHCNRNEREAMRWKAEP